MSTNCKLLIRDAKRRRAKTLDLSGQELSLVPHEIAELPTLVGLDLSNNQLTRLDEELAGLVELEVLDLSNNRLETLPQFLADMPRLRALRLSGNPWSAEFRAVDALTDAVELRTFLRRTAAVQERDILQELSPNRPPTRLASAAPRPDDELKQMTVTFREEKRILSAALEREKRQAESRLPTELELPSAAFRDVQQLSQGGFAVVEKGRLFETWVAIKRFPSVKGSEGDKEFFAELKALARLRHPGVVTLMGYSLSPDKLLVFELINGPNLHVALHVKPLKLNKLRVLRSIAETLVFVHGRQTIHGDLKPLNILLDPSGAPKLIDFGLSRLTKESALCRAVTPAYAAPECFADGGGERADVWAFGVILWEMATGRIPFAGLDAADIRKAVAERRALTHLGCAELPSVVEDVVKACLAHDPAARPAMLDVLKALDRIKDIN